MGLEHWIYKLPLRLRSLFRQSRVEQELREEFEYHLERKIEYLKAQGLAENEARIAAMRAMHGLEQQKEKCREERGVSWIEDPMTDLRYALRAFRKQPSVTLVITISLALGIGANTAIFSLVYAVMLKPLPVPNADQLYRLGDNENCCVMTGTQNEGSFVLYSYPLYQQLRDHTPEFVELSAFASTLSNFSVRHGDSAAAPYKGEFVSGNYFSMLGIRATTGRLLAPTDDSPGAPRVAVINYHTWQQNFGLDPKIVGSTFNINGVPYTIAGVTPAGFYGDTLRSDPPDFWLPLNARTEWPGVRDDQMEWLYLLGRLRTGVRADQVQAKLTTELQRWLNAHLQVIPERDRGDIPRQHIRLTPGGLGVEQMQTNYATGLRLLVTLSGLLLLIACANVANLLLTRGSVHRSYTAVRLALGASRRRLIRQMLTESILLSFVGGVAGLYLAYVGTHAILLLAFRGARYVPIQARPSIPVLGFALLLSFATGIVFGIAPAWMTSHSDPIDALRGAGRSTSDPASAVQRPLAILQIAFSIVLLIGAGLVTQSLRNLENQQFGFVTDGRLIVNINPELAGYTPDRLHFLYDRLNETMPKISGVLSASLSGYSPLGGLNWNERVYIEGKAPDYRWTAPSWDRVGPHYFETIGTRLLEGRTIDERDTPSARRVAVINETFARLFFPNQNPIGQHFGMFDVSHSGDYEIVGIVEDAKYQDTREPAYATFFLPLLQTPPGGPLSGWVNAIELHVAGKPQNFEMAVRKAIADVDPNLTILSIVSFGEQVARNFNEERLIARLTQLFSVLALLLACVGLYGTIGYSVARRTAEIGVRMALGAERGRILLMILSEVSLLVIAGIGIGFPLAWMAAKLLSHQLYDLSPHDPLTIAGSVAAIIAITLVAGYVPARRASKVDPIVALRYE